MGAMERVAVNLTLLLRNQKRSGINFPAASAGLEIDTTGADGQGRIIRCSCTQFSFWSRKPPRSMNTGISSAPRWLVPARTSNPSDCSTARISVANSASPPNMIAGQSYASNVGNIASLALLMQKGEPPRQSRPTVLLSCPLTIVAPRRKRCQSSKRDR